MPQPMSLKCTSSGCWKSGVYELGILMCGSGQGMTISANKVRGVRAALCHDMLSAVLSRNHNDANVLCMGAWMIDFETAGRVATTWLRAGFSGGLHAGRVNKIVALESKGGGE
jgi:ribose 5-phosphate isomerase B